MKKFLSALWAKWCRSSQMVGEAFDVPEVAPKPSMILRVQPVLAVGKVTFLNGQLFEPKPASDVEVAEYLAHQELNAPCVLPRDGYVVARNKKTGQTLFSGVDCLDSGWEVLHTGNRDTCREWFRDNNL
jgi:hypothetical protein